MKTLKLSAGMPLGVEFITRDDECKTGRAWGIEPFKKDGVWMRHGWHGRDSELGIVFIGDALKPGEIAKVVK